MSRRGAVVAIGASVALGALLRALPCWNDFWLDEIWTWGLARGLGSPLEVFTAVHHSNNHHLNTLLFFWLGEPAHWAVYRLPSLLAGVASVGLLALLARRWGRLEAVLAAVLGALCFALVHFSSEARGYSMAVAFALAALWALERDLDEPRSHTALAFGVCTVLGFLSQLVFLFFWLGAFVHSTRRLARRGASSALRGTLRLHAGPLLCFALLYQLDLRQLAVGGGPPLDLAWLVARIAGFSLGLPSGRGWAVPGGILLAALLALGLWRLARRGDDLWLPLLLSIAVVPVGVIAALRPEVVAVRYFLIGIALFLLLLAALLAEGLRAGGAPRALAGVALAVFVLGNGVHCWRFLEHGRGGFEAALETMAAGSEGRRIEVGSDHDFRNATVLRFYARRLPPDRQLDYRERGAWPRGGPEWLVIHRGERPEVPRPSLALDGGERFALVAEFDHAAISGFWWAVYRNAASDSRSSSTTPKRSETKGSAPSRTTRR